MKRAMQTGDMLNDVGPAFEEVFGEEDKNEGQGQGHGKLKSKV